MKKLKLKTDDLTIEYNNKIYAVFSDLVKEFPELVTEIEKDGKLIKTINIEKLRYLIEGFADKNSEVYELTWAGKQKARMASTLPTTNTLRPVPEDSVDFENTENLYIEGDNLEVLKVLKNTYSGKIKMIYIDPPYNTRTAMIYNNDYSESKEEYETKANIRDYEGRLMVNTGSDGKFHSNWLNMMYPTLQLSHKLLTDDGFIAIAIDHNELHNLVSMCDEIFGENNRLGIVTVVHKPEGRNQEKFFATSNEFALFYSKNISVFNFESVILDDKILNTFDQNDNKGKYKLVSLIAKNHGRAGYDKNLKINNPKNFYPVFVSGNLNDISIEEKKGYSKVLPITSTQERTWKYIKETFISKLNLGEFIAKKENGEIKLYEKYREEKGQLIKTHWVDSKYNATNNGTRLLDDLMKVKTFDFPKSLYLLIDILKIGTKNDDLILDFFSGSSTTAHAVMQLNVEDNGNRKYIMVQLPEETSEDSEAYKASYKNICEIGKERIRRAAKKIKEDNKDKDLSKIDFGFRVFKLDSSNMKDVYYSPIKTTQATLRGLETNLKEDRTDKDLLYQVLLEMLIPISAKIQEQKINGKTIYNVNDNYMVACFSDNIDLSLVKEIVNLKPLRIVFKDSSFKDDSTKVNCDEYIRNKLPDCIVKVV